MSPSDIQLAVEAHREAVSALSEFFLEFPMIPRHIVENHIAFEIAFRIRRGVKSKSRLVRYGIEAVLKDKYKATPVRACCASEDASVSA